jgi:tetratricopeptide (TPR) repeat protein
MGLWPRIGVTAVITAATATASWLGTEALGEGKTSAITIAVIAATTAVTLGSAWVSRAKTADDQIRPESAYHSAMLTARSQETAPAEAVRAVTAVESRQPPATAAGIGSPVDHDSQRNRLKEALQATWPNIILVHGRPGAGKTTLVWWVLRDLGLTARPYNLPADTFDARALLAEIEPEPLKTTELRPGEDVLNRLEVAVEARSNPPVIVLVDGAQHLLKAETPLVASLELDEALDVLANGRRQVKVILVLPELPESGTGRGWARKAAKVWVDGLPKRDFRTYVRNLDPEGKYGLRKLTPIQHDSLHEVMQGLPRLANLFRAVLALWLSQGQAATPAHLLAQISDGDQPLKSGEDKEQLLARELVGALSSEQRAVVEALAAYRTPVESWQVRDLLAEELSPGQVSLLLPELAQLDVIGKVSECYYYLPTCAIREELLHLPDGGPARLRHEAANLMSRWRTPKERIQEPEDLKNHFAELAVRLDAQLWGSSYELINIMDTPLNQWNASDLLLKQRETIAGRLANPYREMVNYNALGYIYLSRGRSGKAKEAFESALRNAAKSGRPEFRRKILINLGALYWDSGDTSRAERQYRNAMAIAGEHDNSQDRMAAQAGIADCLRRWGDFRGAIHDGKEALVVAQDRNPEWAVGIAVKLARWHSELGERDDAGRLIEIAEQEARRCPDPVSQVHVLDGRSDLLLDAEEFVDAAKVAQKALEGALRQHDPVTVLQARTTMAWAYLRQDDIPAARREIERAAPYRQEGRSLIVLALQALIAFRVDPNGNARKLFAKLEKEAIGRRERDGRDFAAWDLEGLAICGSRVGRAGSLEAAVTAFRRARHQAPAPPALDARLRFMLSILETSATPGQLDPVVAAATGAAARLDQL